MSTQSSPPEPPPPYTLSKDSSTRPKQRVIYIDGQPVHVDSTIDDAVIAHKSNHSSEHLPLRCTKESQTFYFYGGNNNDGTGGEIRIQTYPIHVDGKDCDKTYREGSNNKALKTPYDYPDNFVCWKCNNSGTTRKGDKPCSICFRRFSTQRIKYDNPLLNLFANTKRREWVDRGDGACSSCLGTGKTSHNRLLRVKGTCRACDGSGREWALN